MSKILNYLSENIDQISLELEEAKQDFVKFIVDLVKDHHLKIVGDNYICLERQIINFIFKDKFSSVEFEIQAKMLSETNIIEEIYPYFVWFDDEKTIHFRLNRSQFKTGYVEWKKASGKLFESTIEFKQKMWLIESLLKLKEITGKTNLIGPIILEKYMVLEKYEFADNFQRKEAGK